MRIPEAEKIMTMIKVAELRAKSLSPQEISENLGFNLATVYRYLDSAIAQGVLTFSVDPVRALEVGRDPKIEQLESKLCALYDLKAAFVLRVPRIYSSPDRYEKERDNVLHEALGVFTAKHVLGEILQPGDSIGVGGGRTLYHMALALQSITSPLRPENVTVLSLSGGPPCRILGRRQDISASADTVAHALALALAQEIGFPASRLSLVHLPPLASSQEEKTGVLKSLSTARCLTSEGWAELKPRIAMFGIGNVSRTYAHFLTDPSLEPAPESLRELSRLVSRIESEIQVRGGSEIGRYYYPAGEILNRVFVASPPPILESLVSSHVRDDLNSRAQEIGRCAFGVSHDQLQEVPVRFGVAGGLHKYFLIKEAIQRKIVNYLVTDQWTAKMLISEGK